jgi:hypothetical protein
MEVPAHHRQRRFELDGGGADASLRTPYLVLPDLDAGDRSHVDALGRARRSPLDPRDPDDGRMT